MTWSIIARDELTGRFGIAVATRFFAVGARVPYVAAGIGAIATQALVNPYYGIDGLKLLRDGRSPRDIVDTLIAGDDGQASRQLHVMDAAGRIASHTGQDCVGWCGHLEGDGFSIAGNMLAGAQVLDHTAGAYAEHKALPFAQRLIAAMAAGEAAGGDKRGRQSGGACDLRRGGMVRSRFARRRPFRSAGRTGPARTSQPRALGPFSAVSAQP
jgi:uncharacterized Ntn-hydrolase superfamily protein